MNRLRFLTAGESHGPALVGILDGLPAGLALSTAQLALELSRRKLGYGRGGRMAIEPEQPRILSGVRHGRTLGSPLSVLIENVDHARAWSTRMAVEEVDGPEARGREVMLPRPGHADLAGAIKYGHRDLRNSLERASARETAMRVALGAAARALLSALDIRVGSYVRSLGSAQARGPEELSSELRALADEDASELGRRADQSQVRCLDPEAEESLVAAVDAARARRDTLGGTFEVRVTGLPPGLGSYAQGDLKLDGLLARALCSIPAIKAAEIGEGFAAAARYGSQVHDPIERSGAGLSRPSNRAGGLEGGVTNGSALWVRAAMKPIATVSAALPSVHLGSGAAEPAHVERSDTCAVPAAAVVGEAVVALALADALLIKLGGDSLDELHSALRESFRRGRLLPGHVYVCGLPGAGKSTLAPQLAGQLGLPCLDLDAAVEHAAGRRVSQIFADEGEGGFREREVEALRKLSGHAPSVISLGGGALLSPAVRQLVRRTGHLLWLRAPAAVCASRLGSAADRPLLARAPQELMAQLASERDPLYARLADAVLEAELPPEVLARLAAAQVRALEARRAHA